MVSIFLARLKTFISFSQVLELMEKVTYPTLTLNSKIQILPGKSALGTRIKDYFKLEANQTKLVGTHLRNAENMEPLLYAIFYVYFSS
jgi:hypothetical protein